MGTGSAHSHGSDTALSFPQWTELGEHTHIHAYLLLLYLDTSIKNHEFTPTQPTQSTLKDSFKSPSFLFL